MCDTVVVPAAVAAVLLPLPSPSCYRATVSVVVGMRAMAVAEAALCLPWLPPSRCASGLAPHAHQWLAQGTGRTTPLLRRCPQGRGARERCICGDTLLLRTL